MSPLPTRANTSRPVADGYGALIEFDGRTDAETLFVRLAVGPGRELRWRTSPMETERVSTEETPQDIRPGQSGEVYSRTDHSGGEGLAEAHRRDATESDHRRFWESENIDVVRGEGGELAKLQLSKDFEVLTSALSAADWHISGRGDTQELWELRGGDRVRFTTDPFAASVTWTEETITGLADGTDIVSWGDEMYVSDSVDGIYRRDTNGTWTLWTTTARPRLMWVVKDRIVSAGAVSDGGLGQVNSDGTSSNIHTLAPGNKWHSVTDAGAAILAAASDGNIYTFVDEDGTLVLVGQTRFQGEIPISILGAQGIVLILTWSGPGAAEPKWRLWRAVLVGERLRDAQVLREWVTAAGSGNDIAAMYASRDHAWIGVREEPEWRGALQFTLWRYDFATGGLTRHWTLDTAAAVFDILSISDRLFFSRKNNTDGIHRQTTDFVSSGWLVGAAADFFSAAPKQWLGARLESSFIQSGGNIRLESTIDRNQMVTAPNTEFVNVHWNGEQGDGSEKLITNVTSRWLVPRVAITRETSGGSPEVNAWSFRGVSSPEEVVAEIPINVSDRLEIPGRKPQTVSGSGDRMWDQLKSLEGKNAKVTLLKTGDEVDGQIESVTAPIPATAERGSQSVYCLLTVVGTQVAT